MSRSAEEFLTRTAAEVVGSGSKDSYRRPEERDRRDNRDRYSRGNGDGGRAGGGPHNGGEYHRHRDNYRERDNRDRYSRESHRDSFKSRDRWDREPRDMGRSSRGHPERDWDRDRDRDRDNYRQSRGSTSYSRGGGDWERDNRTNRDDFSRESRKRHRDPPSQALDNVIPINERRRMRPSFWDIKPQGYEKVTAEMAKISGYFALPNLPENSPTGLRDPLPSPPPASVLLGDIAALLPGLSRLARRIIISGYDPEYTSQDTIMKHVRLAMSGLAPSEFRKGENTNGFSVRADTDEEPELDYFISAAYFTIKREYFLVEFTIPEYASALVALSDIPLDPQDEEISKYVIQRPQDYVSPHGPREKLYYDEVAPPTIPDSPNKCVIRGLASILEAEQTCDLLAAFGELKNFYVMPHYGVAIFEYANPEITDLAVQGLSGQIVADSELQLSRLCDGLHEDKLAARAEVDQLGFIANGGPKYPPSTVMQVLNGITIEDALNDEERDHVIEQVRTECEKIGEVVDVRIPVDKANLRTGGKIFVKFASQKSCCAAVDYFGGKSFSGKTLITAYGCEQSFDLGIY